MADAHLSVVLDKTTGLYHGAVFRNHPTPSGADRFLLSSTTGTGYDSERAAAEAINAARPDLTPIAIDALPAPEPRIELPVGATLTVITPRDGRAREPGVPEYELTHDGKRQALALTPRQFSALIATRRIEMDSSSGNNPELHYRYDHYEVLH